MTTTISNKSTTVIFNSSFKMYIFIVVKNIFIHFQEYLLLIKCHYWKKLFNNKKQKNSKGNNPNKIFTKVTYSLYTQLYCLSSITNCVAT